MPPAPNPSPALQGPATQGPALQGPATQGPALQLDPRLQQALAAHLHYLRDLGIYDLYRRPGSAPLEAARAQPEATTALPHPHPQEPVIPVRKPFPSQPPVGSYISPASRAEALRAIQFEIGDCTRCALARGRTHIVFGDGDPNARLMFVGEGPGADEDLQGLPFVGRAGQLLNNMIAAMGLTRQQVYIANIVKCRPPQNRVPEPEEAHTCSPFLFQQIDVIRPEVIVALGATAAIYLLGVKAPLTALRGRLQQCRGVKLIVTYHPAYLLRDPRQKKEAWQDLQLAMAELGLKGAAR